MRLHPEARVAEYRAQGWWTNQQWTDFLGCYVRARPDEIAIVDPPNRTDITDGTPGRWTWAELGTEVDRLAAVFLASGLAPGDVVGVQLANVRELAQTYLALATIGAIVSPFPVQFRRHELVQLGVVTGLRAFVTSARVRDRANAVLIDELRSEIPTLTTVLSFGSGDLPARAVALDEALAAGPDVDAVARHRASHRADGNDCVTICWTSGTEAVPKGIPRCHDDWIAITWGEVDAARLTPDDVILSPFPMVNMAGIGGTFLPWLMCGGRLVLHHPFDLELFLHQIEEEQATFTVAGPALLTTLLQHPEQLAETDISSLRVIGSGSAPLPPATVVGWEKTHGVEIINIYGSNEGVALINDAISIPDAADRAVYFPRWGRPEHPWPAVRTANWMSTKLVDLETGDEVTTPGQPGELRAKGPVVFAGYLAAQHLPDPFDADGYCRSGDLFEIAGDQGQYYRYVDRVKDIIIRGGFNISAAEIENLVLSHPNVAEAAAVGYHDDVLGERTCVFVVPRAGADVDLARVCAHFTERGVATYKHPERLVVVPELPRNPLGKVVKDELRQLLVGNP